MFLFVFRHHICLHITCSLHYVFLGSWFRRIYFLSVFISCLYGFSFAISYRNLLLWSHFLISSFYPITSFFKYIVHPFLCKFSFFFLLFLSFCLIFFFFSSAVFYSYFLFFVLLFFLPFFLFSFITSPSLTFFVSPFPSAFTSLRITRQVIHGRGNTHRRTRIHTYIYICARVCMNHDE